MSTSISVTEDDGDRAPLLPTPSPDGGGGEIVPFSPPADDANYETFPPPSTTITDNNSTTTTPTGSKQRLVSLDVFRGLTVALMILVDDAGGAFPSINHSPWFGVTLADFVMPFFLFSVGLSVGLVFKEVSNKAAATNKVLIRTVKLFLLGLILQGGYFHGRNDLTYGVDVSRIRWMGVLQRISIGYLMASILEIWVVSSSEVDSVVAFAKKYCRQWVAAFLLGLLYISLLYGLYVPNWSFDLSTMTSSLSGFESDVLTVQCGVRGSLEPPCNAVGYIDRIFLGEHHLYKRPVYRRTKECSINSPDYGPAPPNSPGWCLAPFDPEGLLSSLMAAVTCFFGLHYGHIIVHFKGHTQRIVLWSMCSSSLMITGYVFSVIGVPLSKPLYTLSYMCITTGASGFLLTIIYYAVDVKDIRKPFVVFQWMGMNALIIYALAACDLFPITLQGFYWRLPEYNLVNVTESVLQTAFHSKKFGTLAFVILEILFWGVFAGFLHTKSVYFRL